MIQRLTPYARDQGGTLSPNVADEKIYDRAKRGKEGGISFLNRKGERGTKGEGWFCHLLPRLDTWESLSG